MSIKRNTGQKSVAYVSCRKPAQAFEKQQQKKNSRAAVELRHHDSHVTLL